MVASGSATVTVASGIDTTFPRKSSGNLFRIAASERFATATCGDEAMGAPAAGVAPTSRGTRAVAVAFAAPAPGADTAALSFPNIFLNSVNMECRGEAWELALGRNT